MVSGFTVPTTDEKKFLYTILNIDCKKYFNSIDGIILNVESISKVKSKNIKNFNWFYLMIMNEKTTGTNNLLKLVILNISILTLISLIIWTFISYSQGESLSIVNIVLIILIAPFVYSLSKDVSSVYKSFK